MFRCVHNVKCVHSVLVTKTVFIVHCVYWVCVRVFCTLSSVQSVNMYCLYVNCFCFCTVWSTLSRISLTKALVLWWCDNKSDLIWFDLMLLKITLFCVFGVTQYLRGSRFKKHYFPHTVHYCCSSMLRLSETCQFVQSSPFWEARCALIDQLSGALWLAEYLKRVTEMLRALPCCDAVSHLLHSVRT